MTVFIHDASILLDLIHTDLLQLFLAIPVRMVTTDFVVEEIFVDADKEKLEAATSSGILQVLTSGLAEFESIAALQSIHRALSIADCSVLFYANRLQSVTSVSCTVDTLKDRNSVNIIVFHDEGEMRAQTAVVCRSLYSTSDDGLS